MLFSITMIDKPDSAVLRARNATEHGIYISCHVDGMRLGGPLVADDGETPIGSLIIKEFADRRAAEAFVDAEPYNQAGLFEVVIIRAFCAVVDKSAYVFEVKAD